MGMVDQKPPSSQFFAILIILALIGGLYGFAKMVNYVF